MSRVKLELIANEQRIITITGEFADKSGLGEFVSWTGYYANDDKTNKTESIPLNCALIKVIEDMEDISKKRALKNYEIKYEVTER